MAKLFFMQVMVAVVAENCNEAMDNIAEVLSANAGVSTATCPEDNPMFDWQLVMPEGKPLVQRIEEFPSLCKLQLAKLNHQLSVFDIVAMKEDKTEHSSILNHVYSH